MDSTCSFSNIDTLTRIETTETQTDTIHKEKVRNAGKISENVFHFPGGSAKDLTVLRSQGTERSQRAVKNSKLPHVDRLILHAPGYGTLEAGTGRRLCDVNSEEERSNHQPESVKLSATNNVFFLRGFSTVNNEWIYKGIFFRILHHFVLLEQ